MVEFVQKLDRNKKIYIPKMLRESGFFEKIKIIPNYNAAIMFPSNINLSHVKDSVEVLLNDIKNRIGAESQKTKSGEKNV